MPTYRFFLVAVLMLLLVSGISATSAQSIIDNSGFADPAFQQLWARTDAPVAGGAAARSWVWGAQPGERRYEQFTGAPGDTRLVQYFDKARMEINDPGGDRASPWFVTNGLLVVELIRGDIQTGSSSVERREPALLPIAGDPTNNPTAPTYAALAPVLSTDADNPVPSRVGQPVSATYGASGDIGSRPDLALPATEIARYEPATGRNVPRVFDEFMRASGPINQNGTPTQGQIVDPLFAFGYPVTEPYWAEVTIDGQPTWVLFQAYERRLLTYTPANPPDWQVEMGNVGQHYVRWRYGQRLTYAQPPFPEGIRVRSTTIDIPTYAYEQALEPTTPEDPIYPYQRLNPEQIGPPETRSYALTIIENRFLELSFLPDLGGRLYKAVDKTTGDNLFYQNPVIKPAPFGQRGWWLGVGGLEWAVPTEEHGYLEHLPWDTSIDQQANAATFTASITEQQSGMQAQGSITLARDETRFQSRLAVANPTDSAHPLQMWTNAMLAPGSANDIEAGLRFVMPTDQLIVHAAQDSEVPAPQELMPWPRLNGRTMSYPANWNGYVGAFAPQPVPFFGAYDSLQDAGVAIVPGADTGGAKIFAFSQNFDRSLFTDDGSDYIELWSGAQPTFWDYPPLPPGATRTIQATWLPLQRIGNLAVASEAGALGLIQRPDGNTTVTLATSQILPATVVVLRVDGQEVFRSAALDLRPDLPLAIDLPFNASGSVVQVEAGDLVLTTTTAGEIR